MKIFKNFAKKTKSIKKNFFTLIELLAAMGVLTILMFVLISFFAAAQKAWTMSNARAETYENARIALDLIARDLQAIYYESDKIPFWHWRPSDPANPPNWNWSSSDNNDYNEFICFISATSNPPNDSPLLSKLCEIKYTVYYDNINDWSNPSTRYNESTNDGWLMRSATGNVLSTGTSNPHWNFYNNFKVGYKTSSRTSAFTARGDDDTTNQNVSSMAWQKVIPYVTNLRFTCYKKDGSEISPDNTTSTVDDAAKITTFPYAIKVELSLLDKASWDKWLSLIRANNTTPLNDHINSANQRAKEFREQNQRTFTKTIFIGERGQRY